MRAPLMRLWQNLLALLGTILAAGALLPLPPRTRLACIAGAVVLIVTLLLLRVRGHQNVRRGAQIDDAFERIEQIRAQRRGSRRRR